MAALICARRADVCTGSALYASTSARIAAVWRVARLYSEFIEGWESQARCGVCAAHVTPLVSSRTPETMSAKEAAPTAEDMTSKD